MYRMQLDIDTYLQHPAQCPIAHCSFHPESGSLELHKALQAYTHIRYGCACVRYLSPGYQTVLSHCQLRGQHPAETVGPYTCL